MRQINRIIQFDIVKSGETIAQVTVDLKNGSGAVYEGAAKEKPDTVFTISYDDLADMVKGKYDAAKAFASGKLKMLGKMLSQQSFDALFQMLGTAPARSGDVTATNASAESGWKVGFIVLVGVSRFLFCCC